ncbi:MAG: hypothetical protein HY958_10140 [Bacteroidia bacterium]|nr:hypothetical protein [Bacteroidia bacterium]
MIEHHGIKFHHDYEKSLVEIDTKINEVTTDKQFVILITKFQEYLEHKRIRHIIINKKNNDFKLSKDYSEYRKTAMEILHKRGIERIIYLVSPGKVSGYQNELPHYVEIVCSYDEII